MADTIDMSNIDETIQEILKKSSGYVSLPYMVRETGIEPEQLKKFFSSNTDKFRESKIRTEEGDEVYTLNTPLSGLADSWKAFCNINSKKY